MLQRVIIPTLVLMGLLQTAGAQTTRSDPGSGTFLGGTKNKKDKEPTSRTLKGTVVDESGKPLSGALVILTNNVTRVKMNFFTKDDGRYNFADLSFTQDYEVIARYKNEASRIRKMSQYDRRPDVVHILEITPDSSADN